MSRLVSGVFVFSVVIASGCASNDSDVNEAMASEVSANQSSGASDSSFDEVRLSESAIKRAGIQIVTVGTSVPLSGSSFPLELRYESDAIAHIGSPAVGRIASVNVRLGDPVSRGAVLATLSSPDAAEARSLLAQSKARLGTATSALRRQEMLVAEGIGAERSLEEAVAEEKALRAEVQGLEGRVAIFGAGEGGMVQLTSPMNGVVTALDASAGETVLAEKELFVVADPNEIWVSGKLTESSAGSISVGDSIEVQLHAYPGVKFGARVARILPGIDELSRTIAVRMTLNSRDNRLMAGLTGTGSVLAKGVDEQLIVVSAEAVTELEGSSIVFVTDGSSGEFVPRTVLVGRRTGTSVEILSGVAAGEKIAGNRAFVLKSILRSSERSDGYAH